MRPFRSTACRRSASRVLIESQRALSSKPEAVVSVRAKGYGPSRDLVRGVQPRSQVVVETRLHPSDIEVQRSVLALTMPTLANVSVVNTPDHSKYRPSPMPPPVAKPQDAPPTAGGDVAWRMEMLETALEEQVTTMANLILQRVQETTGAQLTEMETRQSNESENLANMIVTCLRSEIQRAVAQSAKDTSSVASDDGGSGKAALNVDQIAKAVSQQVASVLQDRVRDEGDRLQSLEKKIDSYFTNLQSAMQRSLDTGSAGGAAVLDAVGSAAAAEDLRTAVVDAVTQATQVQRESLTSVIEDMLAEGRVGGRSASATVDTKALEEFIEGSLRVATDDIRHSVASEVKKALKGKSAASVPKGSGSEEVAVKEIEERLDTAAIAAKRTLNTVEAVQESVEGLHAEQKRVTEVLLGIKDLLEQQAGGSGVADGAAGSANAAAAASAAAADVAAPVQQAVSDLKQAVTALSATMEVNNENLDRQLMGMAQAISESVLAAVESRTGEALASAVSAVEAQVRNLTELQTLQQVSAESADSATTSTKANSNTATETLSNTATSLSNVEANIAAAVEAVLTPKLEETVTRLQAALTPAPESQVALAQSIADAVTAAISTTKANEGEVVASLATSEELVTKLDSLRSDLVATVEQEMSKTHNVDLTPMYKYVDSMLTFLKEELGSQEASIDRKITEAATQLSDAVAKASAARPEVAAEPRPLASNEQLEQIIAKISVAVSDVVSQALPTAVSAASAAASAAPGEAAEAAAAAKANQTVVDALALTSLETSTAKMAEQLSTIQASLENLSHRQQIELRERIVEAISGNEARVKEVTSSLAAIDAALKAQSAALEAFSPSARAKRTESVGSTSARMAELSELRSRTAKRVDSITSIMQRIEKAKNAGEREGLLGQLRNEFDALASLRQQEEEQLSVTATPEALEHQAEVAAVTTPVKRELQRFSAELQEQLTQSTVAQAAVREEILTALRDITGDVKASAESAGDVTKLIEARMGSLEKLMVSQQQATMERVVNEVTSNTTAMMKESSSSQISSVVEQVGRQTESQLLAKMTQGFETQSEAMKTWITETMARRAESPMPASDVNAVAAETARRVEALLQQAAEDSRQVSANAQPVKARVPLWWLLANPLLAGLAVLLCAYYLFACFLVAFVPKEAPEGTARGMAAGTDVSAVSSAPSVKASDAVADGVTGKQPVGTPPSSAETPSRFRRVADRVM